jgi:hypothetical protein
MSSRVGGIGSVDASAANLLFDLRLKRSYVLLKALQGWRIEGRLEERCTTRVQARVWAGVAGIIGEAGISALMIRLLLSKL